MARLAGWSKRIKLTTDNSKIDSDCAHFAVTVFLKAGNGDTTRVFDEVGANKLKIAIADGAASPVEHYVEIDQWDNTNKVAVLHFARTGESILAASAKDYYLYYDNTHADNTTYVGEPSDAVVHNVWDSNFKLVSHMRDDPDTSHIRDSTSNANDGAKKGAAEPAVTTSGKIADAQDHDGTDDYIATALDPSAELGQTITLEAFVYPHAQTNYRGVMGDHTSDPNYTGLAGFQYNTDHWALTYGDGSEWLTNSNQGNLTLNTWAHLVGTIQAGTGGNINVFKDGAQVGTAVSVSTNIGHSSAFAIGRAFAIAGRYFDGIIDEVRVSNIVRTDAWIKASYNSQNDSLLTYGTEEVLVARHGFVNFQVPGIV